MQPIFNVSIMRPIVNVGIMQSIFNVIFDQEYEAVMARHGVLQTFPVHQVVFNIFLSSNLLVNLQSLHQSDSPFSHFHHQVPPLIDLQSGGHHGSDPVKQVFFRTSKVPKPHIWFRFQFSFALQFSFKILTLSLDRPLLRSLWTRCKIGSNALSSLKTFLTPASSPEVLFTLLNYILFKIHF